MSRGNVIAVVAGVVLISLIVIEYRLKARALERRGKPRWHALFGLPAILEIFLDKTAQRARENVSAETSGSQNAEASKEHRDDEEDGPVPIEPPPRDGT